MLLQTIAAGNGRRAAGKAAFKPSARHSRILAQKYRLQENMKLLSVSA